MVIPYLTTLPLEEKFPDTHFSYWIERTFYVDLQAEILKRIVDIWKKPGAKIKKRWTSMRYRFVS